MVLCLVEHEDGVPDEVSLQMLTLARDVAADTDEPLEVVVFGDPGEVDVAVDGDGVEDGMGAVVADEVAPYGVSDVHLVEHDRLDEYAPAAWAESIGQLVDDRGPEAVVAPGTVRGHEVLAHLGARRDLPMAANCIDVTPGESYDLTRQRWGGSLLEHARLGGERKLLTTAPHEIGADPADRAGDARIHRFEPDLDPEDVRVRITRREEADVEGIPLGEARIVVGGGRGVGSAEDFDKLEELADILGGTVGSSRAAVNEGWRPHDDQIGLTGTKITPTVYVACGISGAVQHMVGCKGADNILAINTDPEAAINQKGDYAVIGDLHEIVPAINEALREAGYGD